MPKGCFSAPVTSAKWLFNPLLGQRRRKKNGQKSRYFKLPPNLAHRRLIAEIPKANYCSFFCRLLTIDECIINVWGYTEVLPKQIVLKDFGG